MTAGRKRSLAGAVLLAFLVSSAALGAPMQKQNPGAPGAPPTPTLLQALLYDQTDNPGGNGAPDQNFEAAFDAYDCEGADDFVVPAGGWLIETIDTVGTKSIPGSTGSTVNVTFYTDNAGLPGTAIAACTYAALVPIDTLGSFNITLPVPCSLAAGTYWMAIQTNQDFSPYGQHFWSNRTVASGSNAVWRNPGGGFGTSCTTFTAMTTCGVGGGVNPDFLFRLNGAAAVDLSISKTASAPIVNTGSPVTYTLTVQHVAGGPATNVVVTDVLPASLAYVSNTCGATFAAGTLTWNVGAVAVGGSASCNFTATVASPGPIVNTATIAGDEPDLNPANDSSVVTITGLGEAVVPTVGGLGLAALALALAAAGFLALRRVL